MQVTCAIIWGAGGKVLAARRGPGIHLSGKWEFPGGKVEPNESAEACIVREIREELAIHVRITKKLQEVVHHYPHLSICLLPFECRIVSGTIQLHDHSAVGWFTQAELSRLDLAPADRKVLALLKG